MFQKVLIANRGEIAVRIIRACHELGIKAVAIYSDADRDALHVRYADEAYHCGEAPSAASYLQAERIIEIAKRAQVDAIHPGFGFLSERAFFVDLCRKAGITFIGPDGSVMKAMGDKVTARQMMQKAGVPIVPGTTETLTDDEAETWAKKIGFPVMVKATAGGGGKGMRLVHKEADLRAALQRARSEAQASFGDGSLYIEKFVEEPRHIEIQVMADGHGNVVHLFERECSIQRRHQKVIEEAPANRMTPELRNQMGQAAVAAAKAVNYCGAGTVEFLVDKHNDFYFLEMNTRIQVEHAITEAITGVDLVKTMIRVAAGEKLPFQQEDLAILGHAIEARVYAEDPDRNFAPSPGQILLYREPGGIGIRLDSGVYQGATVTVYYDPMVAKLIAIGRNRAEAIERMRRALSEYVVKGIKTSIPFHQRVLRHPKFIEGKYDTGFIEAHSEELSAKGTDADSEETLRVAMMAAAIAAYRDAKEMGEKGRVTNNGVAEEPWKTFGRRAQMRGALR